MLYKLTKGLSVAIIIELTIGGGRLISFGSISLRMILFSLALLVTAIYINKGKRFPADYIQVLLAFTAMLLIGMLTGFFSGADKNLIWEDIKPLLFFYLLPFFTLSITSDEDTKRIAQIIINTSLIMAVFFLVLISLINAKIIPFLDFYDLTSQTGEFFYRGEYSFFYKGFVYLCVGLIFISFSSSKNKCWLLTLVVLAIFLTFTRGLILALCLTYFSYFILVKKYTPTLILLTTGLIVIFFGKNIYSSISEALYEVSQEKQENTSPDLSTKLLGDREFSDNARKKQIKQVLESATATTAIWGHGFGNGVESKPVHMEISYLEIFHKQGLLGIGVWFLILFRLAKSFFRARVVQSEYAYPFFLAALFMFFQSLTNQYINNPIGMGMVLISLACLHKLGKSPNQEDISTTS